MSIASRIKDAVAPVDEVAAALADQEKQKKSHNDLAIEHAALLVKRAEVLALAGEARLANDRKQYDASKSQSETIDRDIRFNLELQQDARDRIVASQAHIHDLYRDARVRDGEKLKRQSAKHAAEVDEAAEAFARAVNLLYQSRDRLQQFFNGTGILAPNNVALTHRELNDIIGRVIFKFSPWSGIGVAEDNLLPGAVMPPPLSGKPSDILSVADALAPHDARILRVIAEGPNPPPKPVRHAAAEASPPVVMSPPTEPARVDLNDTAAAPTGPTMTAAQVMASGGSRKVTLLDQTTGRARTGE